MANAFVSTSTTSNLVQTAYDRALEFKLRAVPLFRPLADKRPVQQAMPGSSIVFQLYPELAPVTSSLTETVDPDAVAIGNTSTVTVTIDEYGNASIVTQRLETVGLSDIDPAAMNLISYNCANSIDFIAQAALALGTNSIVTSGSASGTLTVATSAPATALATVDNTTNTSTITSKAVRWSVAKMRGANVVPVSGDDYACYLHPDVSLDLRSEAGSNAFFRDAHVYAAPDVLWAGNIGRYEGAFFVENPRCYGGTFTDPVLSGQRGVSYTPAGGSAGATRVYSTYFLGQQALAEAVGYEPQIVVGPVVDKLMRFRPIGWKAMLGWKVFRQESLWQVFTSSTIHPQA
jgi:N4-gp56 family major capsid protein